MKKFLGVVLIFILSTIVAFAQDEPVILSTNLGLVKKVEYVDFEQNNIAQVKQVATVEVLNGEFKRNIVMIDNILTGNPYYDVNLKRGARVVLHVEEVDGNVEFAIENVQRSGVLILLSLLFCGLLLYVGRKKGVFSLVSIGLTCILIYNFLTPLILLGVSPVFATIVISLLSTTLTMYSVGGLNRKSSAAILGCALSLIVAGILALFTVKLANLTGFSTEYSMFLYSAHPELNFVGIAVATMILATLGAVMDVAMSIASTINEIYEIDSSKNVKELFISGMNVGRDIIGTMANTLILVYMGTSLPLLLLASNIDFVKFINLNQVVTEISSALIGSCAIVICVPITAFVASRLVKKSPTNFDFSSLND